MALSSEQKLKGCLIDLYSYHSMKSDVDCHKSISVAVNFPFNGMSQSSIDSSISELASKQNVSDIYVSANRFDIEKCNISDIRSFIKRCDSLANKRLVFCVEYSWIKSLETIDKICSVLEPYEKHSIAISSYYEKPDKLSDLLDIGKHLHSNGSCGYSYFGALPKDKNGIIEILGVGFVSCAVPKQFLSVVI
jgi:hypothetical protein